MSLHIVKTYVYECDICGVSQAEESDEYPDAWEKVDGDDWCDDCLFQKSTLEG